MNETAVANREELEAKGGECVHLPSGWGCWYFDADHSYWRYKADGSRGKRLTGVTTAIRPIDYKPDGLMKWSAKLNGIGIARLVAGSLDDASLVDEVVAELHWLLSEDPDEIWEALSAAKLTYDDIREEAAVRGTNVHELALRALAMGEPVPDLEALTEEERGYASAVIDFWLDHKPETLQAEQIVGSEELGVAGRFDLRAKFSRCDDQLCPCHLGEIGLIDLKTGSWSSASHHVQVALYDLLAEECGLGASDWTGVLYAREDGSYRLWEGLATGDEALDVLKVYRHAGAINGAAGRARKKRS